MRAKKYYLYSERVIFVVKFKEIIVKKDGINLKFNNKNIFLVYRIREYQKLQNQSQNYINNLKKNKIQVKHFRYNNNNKTEVCYYKLYSDKIIPFKYRKKLVEMLLKKEYKDGLSLEEYINKKNELYDGTAKNNSEFVILDVLGSYLCVGDEKKYFELEDIRQYEIPLGSYDWYEQNFDENDEDDDSSPLYIRESFDMNNNLVLLNFRNKWEIRYLDKERYQKWIKKYKRQHKRWKQTSTYKFGILFTYDNHKDRIKDWDWINGQWVDYSDYHVRIERLIDPERPYTFEWCYIDTDNMFTFKGKKYYISNEVKEYQKRDVRERDHRLEYPLDHIIVLEQDGNVYFFNSYGDRINNDLIKEVS
jgi:hypothetical protein